MGLWVLLALVVSGCGSSDVQLETFPARGKVLRSNGQPMTGGLIEFRPQNNTIGMTTGEIQPDGTFELATMVDGQMLPGAMPGVHRVTIMPPLGNQSDQQHAIEPIMLTTTYKIEATGPNELTIQVE